MKHLFIARHGNYGADHKLDELGHTQMTRLGESIKKILNGNSAYLISSTAPRALESSEIIIKQLALPEYEQIQYLWSGDDAPTGTYYYDFSLDNLMTLVNDRKDKADGLVMVTHLEVAEDFPNYFLRKELGIKSNIKRVEKGCAVHLNLENKTYDIIPQKGF